MILCQNCGNDHSNIVNVLLKHFMVNINKRLEKSINRHKALGEKLESYDAIKLEEYYNVINNEDIPSCIREMFADNVSVKVLMEDVLP